VHDVISLSSFALATTNSLQHGYRPDGLVATMTDHTAVRSFTYDTTTLNETGWTDTLGRSMAYTRDASGNVVSTNDGLATTFASFDAKNRVTSTTDALGNTTTYGYLNAGCNCSQENLVTSIHTPDLAAGIDWVMTYDGDARLSSVTDPHGFTESYGYETTGELNKLVDKLTRTTTWSHDQLGRVSSMLDTLNRAHANTYALETAGSWVGPTLMTGSADATAATTTLPGTMRTGDYQIGHNVYQNAGYPAQVSLYQDATIQLGYTEYFDDAKRLQRREDRVGLTIDSTTIPTQSQLGSFRDEQFGFSIDTTLPVLRSMSSNTSSGVEGPSFTQDPFFEMLTQQGYNTDAGGARRSHGMLVAVQPP
jgi:YD repeat-containing protein